MTNLVHISGNLTPPKSSQASTATRTRASSTESHSGLRVRGRVREEGKPSTFNQLWTAEEQKKLEELLVKYPPEEVEQRRWEKIASELENRTTKQVGEKESIDLIWMSNVYERISHK